MGDLSRVALCPVIGLLRLFSTQIIRMCIADPKQPHRTSTSRIRPGQPINETRDRVRKRDQLRRLREPKTATARSRASYKLQKVVQASEKDEQADRNANHNCPSLSKRNMAHGDAPADRTRQRRRLHDRFRAKGNAPRAERASLELVNWLKRRISSAVTMIADSTGSCLRLWLFLLIAFSPYT